MSVSHNILRILNRSKDTVQEEDLIAQLPQPSTNAINWLHKVYQTLRVLEDLDFLTMEKTYTHKRYYINPLGSSWLWQA